MIKNSFLIKISFFFLAIFSFSLFSKGQKNGEFILMGSVLENEAMRLEEVTVTIYEDNEKLFDTITSKKGKFEITLKMSADYIIEFSKPGYVSKSISVSTVPPDKCTVRKWSDDIGPAVSLFKYVSGVNYAVYKRPFAYFEFTENCSFQKDETYAKTVSAIQNKIRDDVTKVQKEVTKSSDQENKMKEEQEKQKGADKNYKELIAFADEEFNDKNYENALQIYSEALKVKPNQLYPETQLIRIRGLLAEKQKKQPALTDKKKTEKEETKEEPVKEPVKAIAENKILGKEDLKKIEKKTEALLLRLADDTAVKEANVALEKQREIEKANDLKSILAHTAAKRIFLEEIADSKVKMKKQR